MKRSFSIMQRARKRRGCIRAIRHDSLW